MGTVAKRGTEEMGVVVGGGGDQKGVGVHLGRGREEVRGLADRVELLEARLDQRWAVSVPRPSVPRLPWSRYWSRYL